MKPNAIPREAEAVLAIKTGSKEKLSEIVNAMENDFKNEFFENDNEVYLIIETIQSLGTGMSEKASARLIELLLINPDGIQTMSGSIKGLVESSTNLGVMKTEDGYVEMQNGVRSSIGSLKHETRERLRALAEMTGCEFTIAGDYPQWEYKQDSLIRKVCIDTYKEMYSKEPKITAIHGGLECGVLLTKLEGLDCISLGSNQYEVHTPNEHFSISSSDRVYNFLLKVLSNLK